MQCWCLEVGVVFWEEEGTGGQDVRGLHLRQATRKVLAGWSLVQGVAPNSVTFSFNIYFLKFIWLHRVLVVALRIFSCDMWDLVP